MTDYFSVLDEPPRPWLDPDALKEKFIRLSSEVHPDRVHTAAPAEQEQAQQRYTELNAAYQCLRDPKERLRHWVELALGRKPADVHSVPDGLLDLFMETSQSLGAADAVLAEKSRTSSPLLKVQLLERSQNQIDALNTLRHRLDARRAGAITALQSLDAGWETNPAPPWPQLEELYRLFSYLGRWSAQIQERVVQLSI